MVLTDNHVFETQSYSTQECAELEVLSQLDGWETEFRQLGAGTFQAHFETYVSPKLRITQHYCNQEMTAGGCTPPGHAAWLITQGPHDTVHCQGAPLGTRDVVQFCHHQEGFLRTPVDFKYLEVTIPLSELRRSQSVLAGESSNCFTDSTRKISLPEGFKTNLLIQAYKLLQNAQRLEVQDSERPWLLAAEEDITATLIQALVLPQKIESGARGRNNRIRNMSKARDFIDANLNAPITVQSIAREAGVSLRTLETAFRETFDLSIVHYIKLRRLNAVRHELLVSKDPEIRIKDVARGNGLFHQGQFAGDYRTLFFESPSQTLKLRST